MNRKGDIRNVKSISISNKLTLSKENMEILYFSCTIHLVKKLLTCLRLIFCHLKEPKLRHGFADTMNPMCARQTEVETTEHFLLQCHFCSTQRSELLDNTKKANSYFKNSTDEDQVSHMLYGSKTNSLKNFGQNIILQKIMQKLCSKS